MPKHSPGTRSVKPSGTRGQRCSSEFAPQMFGEAPVPLAIGIFATLKELLVDEADDTAVGRFLRDWTSRPAYLAALARGDARRELAGHLAGEATDNEQQFALLRRARASRTRTPQ
jgi:sRNA-binding protein